MAAIIVAICATYPATVSEEFPPSKTALAPTRPRLTYLPLHAILARPTEGLLCRDRGGGDQALSRSRRRIGSHGDGDTVGTVQDDQTFLGAGTARVGMGLPQ